MERLKLPAVRSDSRELQRDFVKKLPSLNFRTGANVPTIRDTVADVSIPMTSWSPWVPDCGPRQLRRPLRDFERQALERRRDELAHTVEPYDRDVDGDRVALALTDMFGGYTSMRQNGEEAVARVDGAMRVLEPFPAWAIEKACEDIHRNGVFKKNGDEDGRYDRQWAPTDSEIAVIVREKRRLFGDSYYSAVALLDAKVDDQ